MAELVDAPDLGSGIFDVRVRVSPFAPFNLEINSFSLDSDNHSAEQNPISEYHEILSCKYL